MTSSTSFAGVVNPEQADAFDHLVYVRLFEGCNIQCDHCFIPENPKRLSEDQIATMTSVLANVLPAGARVLLQWHGGEPTAIGVGRLQRYLEIVDSNPCGLDLRHGIQTNLMTYSPAMSRLLKGHFGSRVGVSWDPEIRRLKGAGREGGARFEAHFWRNLRRCRADGHTITLVCTVTRPFLERFANPFALLDLLAQERIPYLHLERLTPSGRAAENWGWLGVDNAAYARWMARLAKAYELLQRRSGGRGVARISPLDGLQVALDRLGRGLGGGAGCLSGHCDTRFHTLDATGYRPGCTALTATAIAGGQDSRQVFESLSGERAERTRECRGCRYRAVCSSGCLALARVDASGECAGGYALWESLERLRQTRSSC